MNLQQIKLEKVLGVTVSSNAALASDTNGTIAYPAGCTVVLFNTKTEQQHHIINLSRKTITSLAFSSCGRYIVTGECGHQPAVRVWDLYSDPISGHPGLAPQPQQVSEFVGHKYGVNCVSFSPSGKYVVSVGTQHDMIVNVWDWKNNIKVASNKVSTKVKSVAFAENGSYFVTVGNRHVKFWYLEYGKSKYKEAVPLMGRSAILGEQRNNYFCDVACGRAQCGDSTYAITRSGLLCEFNNRRLLDKWVELRTTSANCITIGENYIFVGCAEGIIRCFDPATLRFITTLPRTHYLGVDVSLGTSITHMASPPPDAKYPDTVAITYNETTHKLTSVYNDHSIYVWDVFNIKRVGKSFSFLYHSACIWGVEMAPPNSPLPPGSFLTCSSDDTIRVWTLDRLNDRTSKGVYRQNVYSNELLKVVYMDKDLNYIKDLDLSVGGGNDKQPETTTSYDGRNGVRCVRISPDGKNLASGDRSGNIRIHDTSTMRELCKIEAHDSEVLCLEYFGTENNVHLMASASRDRLLHVFDVKNGYEFLQTLDDHSSSITAVRFLINQGNVQMASCGADKSLIFRNLGELGGKPQFTRGHNIAGKTTLYDMEVDAGQKHVITACQDRSVRIYSANTGKHTKSFKGSTGDDGTLIKVVLDRTGIYLATSCTDKSLSVYDYYSGECMATMCGHSELATGLRFTNDCRRLISASGDGCIFVWRIPHDMVVTMHARLSQQAMRHGKTIDTDLITNTNPDNLDDPLMPPNYRFSIGQLPQWAKKQFADDSSPPTSMTKNIVVPKGRWAQRAENNITVKSFYSGSSNSSTLNFAEKQQQQQQQRFDSDESKDSSLEENRVVKETISISKQNTIMTTRRETLSDNMTDTGFESTAHDGDIDSDNDYRHLPLYYPNHGDTTSGSEFTVTNIDVEELRKSQRKKKNNNNTNGNQPQILIQQASSTYGSQESDDDDDEVSTPSGDNTDRNPMSLFSVSSESLDQLVNRAKYLQSTFESMSGAETDTSHHTPVTGKTSISSKFLTRSTDINAAAINAVKQTKSDPEVLKKRQLLNKRIAETKKKLESVGHTSPLKYSQSIHDLSHIPERDKWAKKQGNNNDKTTTISSVVTTTTDNQYIMTNPICSTNNTSITSSINIKDLTNSVPTDLQLCGCYMQDIAKNTSQLSHLFISSNNIISNKDDKSLNDLIRPRKLKLDKTLTKYKMHKSLPVSPVSEERSFSDFVLQQQQQQQQQDGAFVRNSARRSFSYFVDLSKDNDESFRQICSEIEKFSQDIQKKNDEIDINKDEEDGNFSSDSLEEYSFRSVGIKDKKLSSSSAKTVLPPRRCVSNNELCRYQQDEEEDGIDEIPKSESFYLNPQIQNSQDSILSDDLDYYPPGQLLKSGCNSMESILSNDSDCKSAPLEALFAPQKKFKACSVVHSQSLPKNMGSSSDIIIETPPPLSPIPPKLKTSQTQTDFITPQEIIATKKLNASAEFQEKLMRFESIAAKRKPVAFFVVAESDERPIPKPRTLKNKISTNTTINKPPLLSSDMSMNIPNMKTKNQQYQSKFCNVLNNKPEFNIEIYSTSGGGTSKTNVCSNTLKFEKNTNKKQHVQETSSLDRHLFAKSLLTENSSEKICHKPPKAVRRHSSKTRKTTKTYEYIKKEDYYSTTNKKNNTNNNNKKHDVFLNNRSIVSDENTIDLNYKEKNVEKDLENSNNSKSNPVILNELYDSLDKTIFNSKIDQDSLELNLNHETKIIDKSLDQDSINVYSENYSKFVNNDRKQQQQLQQQQQQRTNDTLLENIKILNKIQRKINKINSLVDIFKKNMCSGKVRALSSMYETLASSQSYYNDLTKLQVVPIRFRRRNLSLPTFVERRLNFESPSSSNAQQQQQQHQSLKQQQQQTEKLKNTNIDGSYNSNNTAAEVYIDVSSPDSSLRRSCSLSDLSMQKPVVSKNKIEQVSGKKPQPAFRSSSSVNKYTKNNSLMTRSRSSGVLNQSDSDNESNDKKVSRLMRPTISSHNKINKTLQIRKKQSYSTSNLNQVGIDNVSTSDDEIETVKPAVPPRNRANYDGGGGGGGGSNTPQTTPRRHLNNKDKSKVSYNFGNSPKYDLDDNHETDLNKDNDLSTLEISPKSLDDVIQNLIKSADEVVALYNGCDIDDVEKSNSQDPNIDMEKKLEMSILQVYKVLHDCIFKKVRQKLNGNVDVNQTDTVKKLNDLVSKGPNGGPNVVNIMEQYSDILLDMVQQAIHNNSNNI